MSPRLRTPLSLPKGQRRAPPLTPVGPHQQRLHQLGALERDPGDFRTDAQRLCDLLWFAEVASARDEGRSPQRSPELMELDFFILEASLARGPVSHYDVEGATLEHNAQLRAITEASSLPQPCSPLPHAVYISFCTCASCRASPPTHTTLVTPPQLECPAKDTSPP